MITPKVIILLVDILTGLSVKASSPKPLVAMSLVTNTPVLSMQELGVALSPSDLLASSSHNLYQSVFLKVSKPTWPELTCEGQCLTERYDETKYWYRTDQSIGFYEATNMTKARCLETCLAGDWCNGVIQETLEKDPQPETLGRCQTLTVESYFGPVDPKYTVFRLDLECCKHNPAKNALYETLKTSTMNRHRAAISHLKTKFEDISQAYDAHSKLLQRPRKRRDFDSAMEQIPIIGHLYGILKSPWERKKIKKHLGQLQGRFEQFAQQTRSRRGNSRRRYSPSWPTPCRTQTSY